MYMYSKTLVKSLFSQLVSVVTGFKGMFSLIYYSYVSPSLLLNIYIFHTATLEKVHHSS